MYELKLADGTRLKNLGLNGNNFINNEKLDESIFEGNLATLTIIGEGVTEVMHNAVFVGQHEEPDGWYFSFRELTPQEIFNASTQSRMEYLGMMTDVDLEEV